MLSVGPVRLGRHLLHGSLTTLVVRILLPRQPGSPGAAAIAYGVRAVLESGVEPSLSKSRRVAALWSSTCF